MGRHPLKIATSRGGSGSSSKNMVPWTHLSPSPKRHLDLFTIQSFSAGLSIVTDRTTDKPRYPVCNSRPHLRTYYDAP